jgi:deoxycytidylate deaminase
MTTETFHRPEINFPEVFIGIVSPVGTNIKHSVDCIKKSFAQKGYETHHIKISNKFETLAKLLNYNEISSDSRFKRIETYIKFGNHLREKFGGDVCAALAVAEILKNRALSPPEYGFSKHVYIIDQLKSEDELSLLREVYGASFLQISIYSARDVRVDNLSRDMARDDKTRNRNSYREKAERLVVIDEDQHEVPHGQKVGKIFQLADVVLNADNYDDHDNIEQQTERFVDLLFGHNGHSPNRFEYGMYLAHSAALRSLDLSRQVGAAIFRKTGEIASLGANEVPKAGGGTYWADDPYDAREYKLNSDSNDSRKLELLNEVLEIAFEKKNFTLNDEQSRKLKNSQFMDALEYGRIIHAEMSAISDAARLGINLQDGTLYCTTFPCHMCSKHIVAAGLSKVVFLEPYPKSLTSDLHSDSVKIEGSSRGTYEKFPAVEFVPFYGITPRRYREFFYRGKRKNGSEFQTFKREPPQPFISIMAPWYGSRETELIRALESKLTNSVPTPSTDSGDATR